MVTGSYDVAIEKGLDGVDVTSVAFANALPSVWRWAQQY